MSISKTGCSKSITKEDLEYKYKKGFSDGAKAVCGLILETLKDQRFDILDSSNNEIALQTINTSIKSVQDRLDKYNNNTKLKECNSKQTNADRIRNMSDEELAEWINTKSTCEQCANYYEPEDACAKGPCTSSILRWLRSEAE